MSATLGDVQVRPFPDRFGSDPVIGWRAWKLDDRGWLTSLHLPMSWVPLHPHSARCHKMPIMMCDKGICPRRKCTCGIYALNDKYGIALRLSLQLADSMSPESSRRVVGRVSLWGRIIEHEKGWRAQHAYPYELWVPPTLEDEAPALRRRYGVDVSTIEEVT